MKKALVFLFLCRLVSNSLFSDSDERPNIVYIMSDELAYFEVSYMGSEKLKTPRIDRMAKEGIRFDRAYAASPVCAPLRCNLMTGKHAGHASVRENDGGTPLRADEVTVAKALEDRGYGTGGFGKWGAGGRGSTGVPEKHGFDVFYGYYDQVHAHTFYPPYLVRNSREVILPGNKGGRSGQTYSHYEIMDEALAFIREHRDEPFFCYLPITPPHGMYDIPKDDPAWDLYKNESWIKDPEVPQDAKNYAAMVTMTDRHVGDTLDLLKELGIDEKTIVFFSGDNGGQDRFKSTAYPRGYFGPNINPVTGQGFRGGKTNLYEGGLRIPFLVRWPGKIEPGRVSDFMFYQIDIFPTLTEIAGAKNPPGLDGRSILPVLLGNRGTEDPAYNHDYFYWEFREQYAVRSGSWKAIKPGKHKSWELYDMEKDISESVDLSISSPQKLVELIAMAKAAHEPVRSGTFADPERKDHERDRWAKWGTSGEGPPPRKK